MNKKTLTLGFVGLMGIAIALAYAAGKQSNQLSQEQMSFNQHQVQWEFPKLTTQIWDQVMSHLTTWAKNHESRLQTFAANPNYPNLTDEQTSFMDLTAEKHGNILNAEMRNGLAQKLTFTVTNHEMRLRALEDKPAPKPEIKISRCTVHPDFSRSCRVTNPTELQQSINKGLYSFMIQIRKQYNKSWPDFIYWGTKYDQGSFYFSEPAFYDKYRNFIDIDPRIINGWKFIDDDNYEEYVPLSDPDKEKRLYPDSQFSTDPDNDFNIRTYGSRLIYKKIIPWPHIETDAAELCYKDCSTRIGRAKCESYIMSPQAYNNMKQICESITDQKSCSQKIRQCHRIN